MTVEEARREFRRLSADSVFWGDRACHWSCPGCHDLDLYVESLSLQIDNLVAEQHRAPMSPRSSETQARPAERV